MNHPVRIDEKGNNSSQFNRKATVKVFIIIFLAILSRFLPLPGLSENPAAQISMMIFVAAAGLWITEAIPPFATAIMVIVLHVFLIGIRARTLGLDITPQVFLNPVANLTMVLFFGGFIMALAASKHGLDIRLARAFIKPFGTRPSMLLLGIMITTALFSMFISNTATTAMMIAILAPVFHQFERGEKFLKALILAVPFSANIGGMGTIIGTPPNAVAAMLLGQKGIPVSFYGWMMIGVPLVIILLFLLWLVLITFFKPSQKRFEIHFPESPKMTWNLWIISITFALTVSLWLTEGLHGISSGVVAMLPVLVFTMLGIITAADLQKIEWHVLALLAGGMVLGVALNTTKLSLILVESLPLEVMAPIVLLAAMVGITLLLSNFMSNTAAANLLIPIVLTITLISPTLSAVAVALAASLAMSLPISTPPNAIAYATGSISTQDMAKIGTLISILGICVVLLLLYFLNETNVLSSIISGA
jgi:solute carrier family 13 (sodium-dependent dicarboxylate transporter), member 2/3/5